MSLNTTQVQVSYYNSKLFDTSYMNLICIIESTDRGLAFRKYSAQEMKKTEKQRTPEKEILYHGNVGKVQGESGHDQKEYKRIAEEILDEVLPDGQTAEGEEENAPNKEWPKEVKVDVLAGTKQVPKPWKKTNEREAFFTSKLF